MRKRRLETSNRHYLRRQKEIIKLNVERVYTHIRELCLYDVYSPRIKEFPEDDQIIDWLIMHDFDLSEEYFTYQKGSPEIFQCLFDLLSSPWKEWERYLDQESHFRRFPKSCAFGQNYLDNEYFRLTQESSPLFYVVYH